MRFFNSLVSVPLLLLAMACSKENATKAAGARVMYFTATFGDTRIVRNDQGKSEWVKGDRIRIYYESDTYVTATAQSDGAETTFITDSGIPAESENFVAVYPASRNYTFGGGDLSDENLTINYQEALPANFENAAVCSAATTADERKLAFRNRCAILKFTTSSSKIHSATYFCGARKSFGLVGSQEIGYKAGTYYIPVPAGKDLTFSLRLKDCEGWDYPALVKGHQTFEVSHIYDLGTVEDVIFDESTAGSTSMRLLSFNILRGDLQGPDHLWAGRRDACLAMLAADKPDVFGLMECNSVQRDDILDSFPEYGRIGVAVNGAVFDHPTTSSNPIFYDGSKMLLEDWGTFWLSDTPMARGSYTWYYGKPRIFTWARFKLKREDARFIYIAVHLQDNSSGIKPEYAGRESYCGPENRRKSAALIRQTVTDTINPSGLPMLLSGDLNATASSSELSALYDILDLAADKTSASDKGNTFNSYSDGGKSRIDHIFCKGCLVRSFSVDRSTYKGVQFISDHWPVYADFTISVPPSEKEFGSALEGWTQDNI